VIIKQRKNVLVRGQSQGLDLSLLEENHIHIIHAQDLQNVLVHAQDRLRGVRVQDLQGVHVQDLRSMHIRDHLDALDHLIQETSTLFQGVTSLVHLLLHVHVQDRLRGIRVLDLQGAGKMIDINWSYCNVLYIYLNQQN